MFVFASKFLRLRLVQENFERELVFSSDLLLFFFPLIFGNDLHTHGPGGVSGDVRIVSIDEDKVVAKNSVISKRVSNNNKNLRERHRIVNCLHSTFFIT